MAVYVACVIAVGYVLFLIYYPSSTEEVPQDERVKIQENEVSSRVVPDTVSKEVAPHTTRMLRIASTSLRVHVVETPEERRRGLSGRTALAEGEGMLFVFPNAERYGIWMPDMHFAIDIVWLDEEYSVVHVKANATPESYPEVFTPPVPAWYVLEVPAGFTRTHSITVGTRAFVDEEVPRL